MGGIQFLENPKVGGDEKKSVKMGGMARLGGCLRMGGLIFLLYFANQIFMTIFEKILKSNKLKILLSGLSVIHVHYFEWVEEWLMMYK